MNLEVFIMVAVYIAKKHPLRNINPGRTKNVGPTQEKEVS
jgi:hypothetical protein